MLYKKAQLRHRSSSDGRTNWRHNCDCRIEYLYKWQAAGGQSDAVDVPHRHFPQINGSRFAETSATMIALRRLVSVVLLLLQAALKPAFTGTVSATFSTVVHSFSSVLFLTVLRFRAVCVSFRESRGRRSSVDNRSLPPNHCNWLIIILAPIVRCLKSFKMWTFSWWSVSRCPIRSVAFVLSVLYLKHVK